MKLSRARIGNAGRDVTRVVICTPKCDHKDWEIQLGIPLIIGRLRDRIFEGLPNAAAKDFVLTTRTIPIGADLSMVFPFFMHWLALAEIDRINPVAHIVADLYGHWVDGFSPSPHEWHAAEAAAEDAHWAAEAARAAAHWAAEAARAAAYAAEAARAAAYAARAAGYAARAAGYAARAAARAPRAAKEEAC